MAIALSWKGWVDTDLDFSEFFAASHTLTAWFMPQYPHASEGPIIAENGGGTFVLGQGDFLGGTKGTKLQLAVGSQSTTFATNLDAGKWHHLALVVAVDAGKHTCTLFRDGSALGSPLVVAAGAAGLPSGKLRIGKRTSGQTVGGHDAQCYGLVDDVAVFTAALSASQIQSLKNAKHLDGSESHLLAGYNFKSGSPPAKLARPVTLHGAATRATASSQRLDVDDAKLFMLPTQHQLMDPPFPLGEPWFVIQGYDDPTQSHTGYASFCWDFDIADQSQGGAYPDGSDGAPFYACAPGEVVTALETHVSGTSNDANLIEIQQASKEICAYLHLRKNSAIPHVTDHITMGKKLALVGDTGANVGAFHLHLAVTDMPDGTSGFVTFPVTLCDYEVRKPNGNWHIVQRGVPEQGQVLRLAATPKFDDASLSPWGAVARSGNRLDVVATAKDGKVWSVHWQPDTYAHNWDRWRPVITGIADTGTPVAVVARDAHKLDVFVAGSDQGPFTGAWDRDVSQGQWRGFWNIQSGHVPAGGALTAVSRDPSKLDVFHVSNDGHVYTAAWDANVDDGKWRGWWKIPGITAKPGAPVAAVSRDPNKLDIFVVANDDKTYTAAWDHNVDSGKWRGWWNIKEGHCPSGGTVTAVSRDANKLDIFLVSNDGNIYTAAWDHNVDSGNWRGWWKIPGVTSAKGAPVAAVSRDPNKLDVFVVTGGGHVYTAAWDQNVDSGKWRGWWKIGDLEDVSSGNPIAATARAAEKLDIFVVKNGAMYTAAWDHNAAGGKWQGWWKIGV